MKSCYFRADENILILNFFRETLARDMADNDKMAISGGNGPLATSPVKKGHKRRRTRSHNSSSPSPGTWSADAQKSAPSFDQKISILVENIFLDFC